MKTRLECSNGKAHKFWEVEVDGHDTRVCFGRIGTAGQTRTKSFSSQAAALANAEKLIRQKRSKGYALAEAPPDSDGDFRIEWEDALARLAEQLEPASFAAVEAYAENCAEDEVVLWIDRPWHELAYEELSAYTSVALAVFTEPLISEGPLTLCAEQLLGDEAPRDERGFVFLAELTAEALTTTPDTFAVFASGVSVQEAACFVASDACTHVASHLQARHLFSGGGYGTLDVAPGTKLEFEQLAGAFGGTMGPAEALPFLADTIEDDTVASALWELREGHASVPKGFAWPGDYQGPRFPGKGPREPDQRLDAVEYRQYLASARMSEEGRELLQGMDDYLIDGELGACFVSYLPEDMRTIPERVVFVRDRISQTETLSLVGRGDDDWSAYVFLRPVHCGDVFCAHNVVAVFRDSLTARVVAPAPSDSHFFVSGSLKASVVCESVYIRRRSHLEIGTLVGGIARPVDPAELLPHWSDELADGTPLWELFAESFDEADSETPPETAAVDEPEVPSSRFAIEWPVALARLKKAGLPKPALQSLAHYAKRHAECSVVLWVDEPWAETNYEDMATTEPVGLAVFAAPFACDGPMTLSAEELVGDSSMRDKRAFVFLEEVHAEALTTLPDTLAIFAGGLEVETAACFSAPDATTGIASHLVAPCVVSGNSDGQACLWGSPKVSVDTLVGAVDGPKPDAVTRSLKDAYSHWDELEDGTSVWECFVSAFDDGGSVEPQ